MQTPAGANIEGGTFVVTSWMHVIFNPSFFPRYLHMLMASYLSALFVIAAISAYYLLQKIHTEFAKKCFSFALLAIIILIPLQIVMGDEVGLDVHQYQPIKTAAIEGAWDTQKGAPLLLFTIPNQQEQKNFYSISIPHLASVINTHDWNGELQGLKSVKPVDQPFVALVFYSFRVMVGLGFLMLFIGLAGLWLRYKNQLYKTRWFLKACVYSAPIGFISMITGWFTAEAGRQPWVVYGLVRTSDAVSKVTTTDVVISFVLLFVVYGIIFGVFYFRYLFRLIKKGPTEFKASDTQPFAYMQGGK
jgi:cytochrome d ubiquinol oxidase subunit I